MLRFYEQRGNAVQTALVLLDAGQVAHFEKNYSESLGYLTKAARTFESEDIPELLADARYRQGMLL
ncbi:MAG: hypothetical protein LRY55_05950, partial [Leadbetterella sp.]|nr:hypothetical protein [Leadbetterella sp.]